ncbi:MAG TPA: glycosyltransferase family 4 protein [Phycisphaerae bacterium]|nr:glycosyltransferase family 4 protein [Phycisphaerae bacterium]
MTQNPPNSYSDQSVMDVAFWVDAAMLSREASFVRHLVMGLKAEGQKVTFIAPQGLDLSALPTLGSRVLTYRWTGWERIPVLQRLRLNSVARELGDEPADVIVAWGCADPAPLQLFSQSVPAMPMVVWCWDASELFTPTMKLPTVRHVVASSQAIASRIPESSQIPMTVVHPGVYSDETLACYDVEGQMPCLVSLDPLSNRAAYEALMRACRMLADEGQEFLLFAYDTGKEEYPIWQMAEKMKLLEHLSFVPFQQDAEPLLLHGDLYIHILPTTRVQYRTLEAMARGLSIVTCPNHGADYLIDGQTCRVVGPQTPEAWRDVLLELTRDRAKAAGIARRGQQLMRERHSMGRTLEQFGSICRQAAGMAIPLGSR